MSMRHVYSLRGDFEALEKYRLELEELWETTAPGMERDQLLIDACKADDLADECRPPRPSNVVVLYPRKQETT
jgi:hypothetical protein